MKPKLRDSICGLVGRNPMLGFLLWALDSTVQTNLSSDKCGRSTSELCASDAIV